MCQVDYRPGVNLSFHAATLRDPTLSNREAAHFLRAPAQKCGTDECWMLMLGISLELECWNLELSQRFFISS
jgi:hypothetical protein